MEFKKFTQRDIKFIKILVIGFVVGLIGIILDNYYTLKPYREIQFNESVAGKILQVKRNRGLALVTLDNGSLLQLYGSSNQFYQISNLSSLVRKGDILSKNKNSDTLLVIRPGKNFRFVLGKDVDME